jgi:DNA invertase Pin-like site-specific DNA recombinase
MTKLKTVALYLRVSTGEQTVENQRRELLAAAERRGWTVAAEFCDEGISGANGRDKRPAFDKLCRAVVRHQFDVVAAWSVDRLGRSVQDLVAFLGELHGAGVDLYLDRQGVDTSTPAGKALFQMLGVFAEFERSIIQERITAGIARARAQGTKSGKAFGRPQRYPPSARTLYGHPWRPGRASARRRGCAGQAMRPWLGSRPRCADR